MTPRQRSARMVAGAGLVHRLCPVFPHSPCEEARDGEPCCCCRHDGSRDLFADVVAPPTPAQITESERRADRRFLADPVPLTGFGAL